MGERDPIFGHVSRLSDMQEVQAKGNLVASRRRYVREHFGDAVLQQLVDATPEPANRHLIEEPLPFAWLPFEELMAIDRQIVLGPMHEDVTKMKPFGAEIARYDLPTLYRALFRVGTPAFIMKRMGVAYGMYLRGGWAKGEAPTSKSSTLEVGDVVYPEYFCRYGMSGWLTAAVELSGGKDVRVEHDACVHDDAPRCHWKVAWS